MKRLFAAMGLCALAAVTQAEEVLREISWERQKREGALLAGEVRPADASAAFEYLEVKNAGPRDVMWALLELQRPGITQSRYAIVGQARHEGVEGVAHLVMSSTFAKEETFFSRISLTGTSPWGSFALPFDATGATAPPRKLLVALSLPGRGTVHLGPLRLVQYAEGELPRAASGAWWSPRTAGLVGGLLGSFIGGLGGLIGLLAGRGKGRALAFGLVRAMLALGAVSLVFGVVALLRSQPYEVFYPLLLVGVLCVGLPAFLLRALRRRYEELELRRMKARDLSAGRPA